MKFSFYYFYWIIHDFSDFLRPFLTLWVSTPLIPQIAAGVLLTLVGMTPRESEWEGKSRWGVPSLGEFPLFSQTSPKGSTLPSGGCSTTPLAAQTTCSMECPGGEEACWLFSSDEVIVLVSPGVHPVFCSADARFDISSLTAAYLQLNVK